ncbi:LuxR family transcriptional regulator [Methylosinus sp. H3A]|uniref:helix-turn-helix transcriptional regulator n=1 Tax=Methylosinus sp. H3A TaxID=2785786 RepID=UPI0018C316CF|nr:helix-turn-helix transcriptional regulator [Methylosinus sp. H3A]MBG0811809.1 LuxR family transcriptional regulator [Methylosinus sp. H3A]
MAEFENLVDLIYRSATDPDLWPQAMHDLAACVDAAGGVILTRRADAWLGWRYSSAMAGVDAYLHSPAVATSQATVRLLAAERAGFVDAYDVFTPEEWLADPVMTHWGTPAGLRHAAALAAPMPTDDFVVVQVNRRIGQPPFEPADIARLDAFRPHLARAGFLAARWRLERLRAATEALALIGLPAAVLDTRGRALAANDLVEKMTRHVKWLPDDRLALADSTANGMLRRALADISAPAAATVRSFPARGRADDTVIVHLVPMTGQARDLFDGGCALMVVTPVAVRRAPDAALIRGLFDLTAAEANVASGIVEGLSPEQIAERHGTSRATVRCQLKGVFAKTGVGRQSQLAALLARQLELPYPPTK